MKQDKIYMYVSNDQESLPIAVADSIQELSEQIGVSAASIRTQLSQVRQGKIKKSCYIEVVLPDEDID